MQSLCSRACGCELEQHQEKEKEKEMKRKKERRKDVKIDELGYFKCCLVQLCIGTCTWSQKITCSSLYPQLRELFVVVAVAASS